jgi:hypothetical protein
LAAASTASAGVVLQDNFNADAQMLNWTGDATFSSLPQPPVNGQPSTDLIGTGFFDLQPGNGNYVDLDGSTGYGNLPFAGVLVSNATFGPGSYTLSFDLAGNLRGAPAQTTFVGMINGGVPQLVAALTPANTDPFALHTYSFSTAGGQLYFVDPGPSDQQGNLLDNVTLSSTVPEPAAWALMLIGFAGLGAATRSRRAATAAV